jgi:ABC-type amino acid transport substrate-binding protein
MLPAFGGILALLALLGHAQGQTKAGESGTAAQKPKLRILAVSAPPLADEQLPEGGLAVALVSASLGRPGSGADAETSVRWTKDTLTPQTLADPSVDLALPVEGADCEHPNNLTQTSAALCDAAVFSDPILQVVLGVFTLSNSPFKFDTDDSIIGKTICLSRDHDLSALNGNGRNWASYKRVTVMRRATLLDCVAAVQARDADTFVATDLEGTHLLRRLGLTPYFSMQARPLATAAVHAVVWRDHARAPDLISALNQGLKRLKQSDAYSAIVQKHLIAAASASTTPSRRETAPTAQRAPAAAAPAAAAAPGTAPSGAAPAAAPSVAALPPAAAPKAAAAPTAAAPTAAPRPISPTLDPGNRETALKYLKRGNEELAEGRVAPARLLYERAAEMGLAQAAMALAATYDAVELNQPHLRNVLPDADEARRWYERAVALGAADAGARLQRLGSK